MGDEFKANRLAYLSLTSKNEQPLCSALASRLHDKLMSDSDKYPNLTIRREWTALRMPGHRIDLAVLEGDGATEAKLLRAKMLIEAKAAMAFDPLKKSDLVFPSKDVLADADKLRKFNEVDQRHTLAFFTIYDGLPDCKHHAAIKYIDGMKRHKKRHEDLKDSFLNQGLRRFREAVG
ncbi:MAG: hypothetical protein OXJ53_00345 [Gammaproteobacteria bacterium]|nr:hypothetical protein [Gammaproteobacteria bacterium]MDD9961363.1 hypothetical protein [Gammaproteobacteria bacterium]MDE0273395.1 hypothetical protein [Gammaproteobacteria bacterium]